MEFQFKVYELNEHMPYVNVAVFIYSKPPKFCGSFRLTIPEWVDMRHSLKDNKEIDIDETAGVIERTKGYEKSSGRKIQGPN